MIKLTESVQSVYCNILQNVHIQVMFNIYANNTLSEVNLVLGHAT